MLAILTLSSTQRVDPSAEYLWGALRQGLFVRTLEITTFAGGPYLFVQSHHSTYSRPSPAIPNLTFINSNGGWTATICRA